MYKKFDNLANSIEYTLNDFEGENSGLAEYLNNTLNTSGISIALSQKGDTLAVGVPFIEGGVVFIFKRNKDIGYYHKFSAGTGTEYSTDIGTTVAISPDGLIVAFTFLNNEGYLRVNLLLELRDGSWKNKPIPNPPPLTKEDLDKVTINLTCHPLIMTVETPYGGYIYENRDGVFKLIGRTHVQNHQGETTVKNEKDQAPQKPQSEQTMENQQQAFNGQHTTQGETMNDKPKQQADIHALLSETILNKSVEEVKTLFSILCSAAVSKGMIDQNVAAHLHNLFGTYTKVPKGSTFQPMNPQFQPFAPMQPFMPMGFQQPHFPQPPNMGFQGLHPSQFQNPQAFRPNLPNQGARYEAELTLQQLDSQLAQTMMQLQQLEQAVENNKFHQTSLNAQCAAIRNLLNSTSGK